MFLALNTVCLTLLRNLTVQTDRPLQIDLLADIPQYNRVEIPTMARGLKRIGSNLSHFWYPKNFLSFEQIIILTTKFDRASVFSYARSIRLLWTGSRQWLIREKSILATLVTNRHRLHCQHTQSIWQLWLKNRRRRKTRRRKNKLTFSTEMSCVVLYLELHCQVSLEGGILGDLLVNITQHLSEAVSPNT